MGHRSVLLVGRKTRTDADVVEIPWRRGPKGLLRTTKWLERTFGLQYLYSPRFRALQGIIPPETDILHLHSLHGVEGYADIGALPALSRRLACVITLHDMWMLTGHCAYSGSCERWRTGCGHCPDLTLYPSVPKDGTRLNWLRKRWVLGRSRLSVVAPSEWLAAKARASPFFRGLPVTVVPNAVDTEIFRPHEKGSARDALGLPRDKVIVLLVAHRLELVWKGMPYALQALNRIADPRVLVVLVGQASESLTRELKRPWTLVPYQSDRSRLAQLYAAADMLVMPSVEEVFGMVAAEAMACGTPVVAHAAGGLPEVVGEGEGGLLVPSRDVTALAEAITDLADNETKRRELGRRAALRASERFSLRDQARQYEAVYRDTLDAR